MKRNKWFACRFSEGFSANPGNVYTPFCKFKRFRCKDSKILVKEILKGHLK
jgi:hypothetical protein